MSRQKKQPVMEFDAPKFTVTYSLGHKGFEKKLEIMAFTQRSAVHKAKHEVFKVVKTWDFKIISVIPKG